MADVKRLEVRSIVSARDWKPYVNLVIVHEDGREEDVTQWTPEDAYHHAMGVLACVEASNVDSFLAEFMKERVQLEPEKIVGLLMDFRTWREKRKVRPN